MKLSSSHLNLAAIAAIALATAAPAPLYARTIVRDAMGGDGPTSIRGFVGSQLDSLATYSATAKDLENNNALLPGSNGNYTVEVPHHDFRLVLIE